ncbi:MAG: hypothetical protein RLZZ501_821 [Pseudomonadota bacterium]
MTAASRPSPLALAFALAALLTPMMAAIVPKGVAPLFVVVGLAVLLLFRRAQGHWPRPDRAALAALAALTALGLASLAWTRGLPGDGVMWLRQAVPLLLLGPAVVAAAAVLTAPERLLVGRATLAGCLLGLGVYLFGHFGLGLRTQPGLVAAAMMSWPALAACAATARPRLAGGLLLLVVTALGVGFGSLSAALVMGLGSGAALVTWLAPRRGPVLIAAALAGWILAVPLVATHLPTPEEAANRLPMIASSTVHRLAIYRGTGELVMHAPWFGQGVNASRSLPEGQNEIINYVFYVGDKRFSALSELIPLHPHNALLQLWLELGLAGAVTAILLLATVVRLVLRRTEGASRLWAMAALAGVFGVLNVSFGAWQSWWLCLMLVLAATVRAVSPPPAPRP